MTRKMKKDLTEIERMWTNQKIGNKGLLNGGMQAARWAAPMWTEGKWALHTVRPDTGTAKQGWSSIISHDCDVNGAPYWMLIERHTQDTKCMYCPDPMPDGIVALFKFHNERMIQ